ncbi:tumor necrosis factor receptor superfamily member 14-like [Lycodopsis pacificus]
MRNYRYVHCYQSNRVEEDLQVDSYVSRTSLFTDDLKHGNVSLKIKKVKLSDGGIYRCDVPQLASASKSILVVGAVVRTDCTPQSDLRCISCMNGTFMKNANGLIRCFLCSPCDRGPGLFTQQGCTATTDTVCDVVSGYFCKTSTDETGCSSAQKHSHCDPGGRVKKPGTSRTDTVCGSCPPGHFSLEGVSCTVWTTCTETEVKVKEGSTSSDVVCGAVSRKHYGFIPALILFTLTLVGLRISG